MKDTDCAAGLNWRWSALEENEMERPYKTAMRWLEAITARDKVALLAISHESIEIHSPQGVGIGHTVLSEWFDASPMAINMTSLAERGADVLVHHHIDWFSAANEIESSIDNAALIETRDGKVFSYRRVSEPDRVAPEFTAVPIYVIDGNDFTSLEGFYDIVGQVLIPNAEWGQNLDAFNDILRGGFGTPERGFVIRWLNSGKSQECLGYPETVRQLNFRLQRCDPANVPHVRELLAAAESGQGPTVYDWLVEIIHIHGADGEESEDAVELLLE